MGQTQAAFLVAQVERAAALREPDTLANALEAAVTWMRQGIQSQFDEIYSRWLSIQPALRCVDLSIWESDRTGIDKVAIAFAYLDYYRQVDLSRDERYALLTKLRGLLSPRQYLACARVDLERAQLLSWREEKEALEQALSLCDDALACVEQLEDEDARADAITCRAHVLGNSQRHQEALVEAEKARTIYEKLDNTHSLANICMFVAEVNLMRTRVPEAAVASAEAITGYDRVGDSVGRANALAVRARCWKARGKRPNALRDCQEAVGLYDKGCLRTQQGRVMLFLAELELDSALHAEARRSLETAVEYLRESPERVMFVWALLRLGDFLNRHGQEITAAAKLDEAESFACAAAGANIDELRALPRLSLLLEICRIARDASPPDRPRLRRVSAEALALSQEIEAKEHEEAARAYAAYAG